MTLLKLMGPSSIASYCGTVGSMQRGQLAHVDNAHFFSFVLEAHPFIGVSKIAVHKIFAVAKRSEKLDLKIDSVHAHTWPKVDKLSP
jgi:hypothetical protein